jgi:hypothetical protein
MINQNQRWTYSSKTNPCPICDRTKDGDCRVSETGSMVLCRSSIDGEITKDGWKYIKPNSDDRCGIYVVPQEKSPRPRNKTFTHTYLDRQGREHVQRRRYDAAGKKTCKWKKILGVPESELLPYRYEEVKAAIATGKPIYLVEGELVADELAKLGLIATNLRVSPDAETVELFRGANLILCPDRDFEGVKKAQAKYDLLSPVAASIQMCLAEPERWVYIPEKNGRDLHDWIIDGATVEDIEGAIAPFDLSRFALPEQPDAKPQPRKTAGDMLLQLALQATYFHTPDKIAYADIRTEGDRHTYAVRSKAFRLWLSGEYFSRHGKGIGSQTLQDTLNTLEAIAIFQGETRDVHLRVAEYQGKTYLDLGSADWKAIEIDATGWRMVSDPPVRFWRPDSLLPLPYPVEGGSLDELRQLLNVDGAAWTLIVTFLLFCFCPNSSYPILVLSAHRGSGKSAAAEILKAMIDPGKAPLIKPSNDTHKLAVAASRRWVMGYDNVSHVTPEQSDDLCRLATGFGYSTRSLFTTDEETTFEMTRPQIITAIDALITRDDLADRVLMVQLPEIDEDKRLPQAELKAKVEAVKPRILGALLTALSQTLAELPHTKPDKLPRMADYALFAIAAEKAIGLKQGEFRETFDESREKSRQVVIESSPIGEAILRLMRDRLVWKGTASDLLTELEHHTEDSTVKSRYWPKASNIFKRQLNRLSPDLKALGIEVTEFRQGHECTRILFLEKVVKISSASSASSASDSKLNQGNVFDADDNADDNADDTRLADDKQTIEKNGIVCAENVSQQKLRGNADDADDKKPTLSDEGIPVVGDRCIVTTGRYEGVRVEIKSVNEDGSYECRDVAGKWRVDRTYPLSSLKLVDEVLP